MNILWITLESILPADSGGRIGVFKRLEQVAKKEAIYLFYPYDSIQELTYVDDLKKYCIEVHPYSRKDNMKHALFNLIKYPFTVASRDIPDMKKDIITCIQENKIDIINVDFPHMCVNLLGMKLSIPIVLNEHNIEWKVYRMIAKSQNNPIKKMLYFVDSYRLKQYEKRIMKKLSISLYTFVSDHDMEQMISSKFCNQDQCCLIPVGADIRNGLSSEKNDGGMNILFVGKMSYGPNIEAATWFVNEIFPVILAHCANAKFYIVGKDPTPEITRLASDSIIVTGNVASVEKFYNLADLVVLPLKNGGGVKIKLLEAISYKKKIVSTSIGVEGTLYADGNTIPICDRSTEFAAKCISMLNNKNETDTLISKIYEIFLHNYTWASIGKKYVKQMENMVKRKKE